MRQALTHQSTKTKPYYIPTPDTMRTISDYSTLYPSKYQQPKQYGKAQISTVDSMSKFPKYNADEIDINFLASIKCSVPPSFDLTLYEWIFDCLEEAAHKFSEAIVTPESVERLKDKYLASLPDEKTINAIIEFWKQRRTQKVLIPHLRHEDLGKLGADPYVCFRRRELKLPRKTRRSDAQIVDRLKKLHFDLSMMKLVLQAAIKRDRYKREALALEGELFDKYRLIDNWRKQNKSEWPQNIPSFKIAAQSLLESKKKKHRHDHEENVPGGGYKIAIPVTVLRGSRHARPYYPHEIGRQIQRDLDAILGQGHEMLQNENGVNVDDICPLPEQLSGQNYAPAPWLEGLPVSCRRGRGGRLIFDRPRYQFGLEKSNLGFQNTEEIKFLANSLSQQQQSQVQTPTGNYNVHAFQCAQQILRPMSFQAWIASTAPIMQSLTGSARTKSPKKKRPRADAPENESTVEISRLSSASSPGGSGGGGDGDGGTGQITVKVKSHPKEPRKGTGARFTPHGLAHDDVTVDVK